MLRSRRHPYARIQIPTSLVRRSLAPLLTLSAFAACTPVATTYGPQTPPSPEALPLSASVVIKTPCEQGRELRATIPALLAQGRLDRTIRTLGRADLLCPAEAPSTWGALVVTLAEVGRNEEARALADRIDKLPDAPAEAKHGAKMARARVAGIKLTPDTLAAREEARTLALEAQAAATKGDHVVAKSRWLSAYNAHRPNGPALLGAALASRALGDLADAQKLIDRAIVDYERGHGQRLELEVPNGFGGFVTGVSWGASGRLVAVAHRSMVSIIDAVTLKERVRLRGHLQTITATAFSPDGRSVVTASRDETARVWDVVTGRELRRLEGHTGDVNAVVYDRAGTTIATASRDRTVRLWDAATGALRATLAGHDAAVTSVSFAVSGKYLASASDDSTAIVWDVTSGKPTAKLTGATAPLRAVAFGATVAAGGDDGAIRLFDPTTGALVRQLEGHVSSITALSYSPDGKTLASASLDASVKIFDPAQPKAIRTLEGHAVMALSLAWSQDGKRLATGAFNTVHMWDSNNYAETARLEGHADPVTALAFSADTAMLAVGSSDRSIRLWSSGGAVRRLDGHTGTVTGLAFSPQGGMLASGGLDGTVRRWALLTMAPLVPVEGAGSVQAVAWSPDGGTIAWAAPDASVRFFDNWVQKPRPSEPGPGAYGLAFSPDSKRVVFGAIGKVAIVRDAVSGKDIAQLAGHVGSVNAVSWSADGALIATGSSDKSIRLWDATTFAPRATLPVDSAVQSVVFRPGGGTGIGLAAGLFDGSVRLFTVATGKEVMKLAGHTEVVLSLATSGDGRWLASGARDGTTNVYSLPDAQLRLSLRGVSGRDAAYAFAPTGEIEMFGEARDFPICRVGAVSVPFELCEERFVEPGLLGRTLL